MMTYTPVAFMDAAPVNDLVHEKPSMAFALTKHVNKRYFTIGDGVKNVAPLSTPHGNNRLVTHSAINALYLNSIYITHTAGASPTPLNPSTFTYNPYIYKAGGVSREQGGIIFGMGGILHHTRGFYGMPGSNGWVGVRCSIGVQFTGSLRSNIYHKLPSWILFNLTCIDQTARKSYMSPMRDRRFIHDTHVQHRVEPAIISRLPKYNQAKRYDSAMLVEVDPAVVVLTGAKLYIQVDGEFEEIGTVH